VSEQESYIIVVKPKLEIECSFVDEYTLLHHAYYRNNVPPHERVIVRGKSEEQTCTFCAKKNPEVSFSEEAHLLPASLGNNKYFSLEECDACNEKYGQTYENELALMFGIQRSLAGVKGRNNHPKIKFHTGEMIQFNQKKGTAEIISKDQGKISIEKADGEIKINVDMHKYRPYDAILSILKSAWLFLSESDRAKFPLIRDLIVNRKKPGFLEAKLPCLKPLLGSAHGPIKFYDMFYPGNGKAITSLKLYALKNPSNDLPPLIVQFEFLNRVLFWHYPVKDKKNNEVFPHVHFPFHEQKTDVKMDGFTITDPETTRGDKESLTLSYARMEKFEGDSAPSSAPQNPISKPTPSPQAEVIMRIDGKELKSRLTVLRFDFEVNEFVFEGIDLGGVLWFSENKIFKKQSFKFEMNLTSVPLTSAAKTVEFLEMASDQPKDIEFVFSQSPFFVAYGSKFNMGFDFQALKETIDFIETINKEMKLNLRYPPNLSSDEHRDLRYLAHAIKYGSYRERREPQDKFELSCGADFFKGLDFSTIENGNLNLNGQKEFRFLGKTFGPFGFEMSLERPKLISRTPSTEGKDDYVFSAQSIVYSYPQWIK
jgi:hypothetical protein